MSKLNQMSANREWASRPSDERFTSLPELQAQMQHVKDHSNSKVVPSKSLRADVENGELVIRGPNGSAARFNHWSFGQLCSRVGVPAGYMRDISPAAIALVVDCLNEAIARRDVEDISVLLYKNGGPGELHAVNGPNYGRIWNARVADALVEAFGDGRTGNFRVPGEFGQQVEISKENTTLYASDRDMVVFLADEDKSIDVPNRRDGKTGRLSQGIAIGNSDVGGGMLWVADFIFDYFCKNRIIWGLRQVEELSIRHTASAPYRFQSEVVPVLKQIATSNIRLKQAQIVAAQQAKIDDIDAFLKSRKFSGSQVSAIKGAYKSDEGVELSDSASIWDAVVGITAYARGLEYQDARIDVERAAGKVLQLASAGAVSTLRAA
jgi:hypothetical protein